MKKRAVIALAVLCCMLHLVPVHAADPSQPENTDRPNVLIVLTDDQGWGDLSLHGNKDLSTPNIDSLAKDGVSFDRFYVCAVCAPTRAEFLTGRYHTRGGVTGVSRGAERLDLDERTVAEAFKKAGYATGCFGKWHNGMQYPYHPRARGFDTFVGFCSGHWGDYFNAELERDGEYFKSEGYITDVFADEAIKFIEKYKDKPFFCYVPLCTPHSPMQVPDKYWERHKDKKLLMDHPDKREQSLVHTRAALAMVENIDDNVGRLLKKLEELKLDKNTIVIYFSDNGPNGNRWNGGMKGRKGSVDEGGVRSAMFMRWPGHIKANTQYTRIAGAIDLLPTLTAMAGVARVGDKPIDGRNLSWMLLGIPLRAPVLARHIYSNQNGRVSLRSDRFRLDHQGQLFDMHADPGQKQDVSKLHPEEAKRFKESVKAWRESVGLNTKRTPRPFTVGHKDWPITELPARDATTKGGIKRSSPHPNCSYFFNWTRADDAIQWDVEVLEAGRYEAFVYYACPKADIGSTIELRIGDAATSAKLTKAHDPPLQGKAENKVDMRESLVKDFKPVSLGVINLQKGTGKLTLRALAIPAGQALEFRRLMLRRVE